MRTLQVLFCFLLLIVSASCLASERGYVFAEKANTRNAPNGAINGNLPKGTSVEIYSSVNGWSRISPDGSVPRWISSALLCSNPGC